MSTSIWVIAAGTGGHIHPGLEIVRALKGLSTKEKSPTFVFWGSRDRLENKIIPAEGYELRTLDVGAWKGKSPVSRVVTLLKIVLATTRISVQMLLGQRPQAVLSVGGYVSVPVVLAAALFRIPIFLVEPNVRAGVANKKLSRFAQAAFSVQGSDAKDTFQCRVYEFGNPVRGQFKRVLLRNEARRILVLGGSQGARSLCVSSINVFREISGYSKDLRMVIQAGAANEVLARDLVARFGLQSQIEVLSYVDDLYSYIERSDVVIARAGAMSVAELSLCGVPTIFVPFPHAADDHQRINAKQLETQGAALMVCEGPDLEPGLSAALRFLMFSENSLQQRIRFHEKFLAMGRPEASRQIAQKIIDLLFKR